MYWLTSKLNSTDRKEESHPEILKSGSLNVPKFFLRLSLRAVNSLAISIRQRLGANETQHEIAFLIIMEPGKVVEPF